MDKELVGKINDILFEHDPVQFRDFAPNWYERHAKDIAKLLPNSKNVDDLQNVLYDHFARSYETDIAGNKEDYKTIAEKIYELKN